MSKQYKGVAKDLLLDLFEVGKLAVTGTSPRFGVRHWRSYAPKDIASEERKEMEKKFSKALWRLKKSRLVIVQEEKDGVFHIELTEKGKRKVREIRFVDLAIEKPKQWDEIWRVVIFDIPNMKSKGRDILREKLKELNFYQLQKSVWAFPYPCEPEIEFIVELFDLYPYVNIIEARRIKNDAKLQKHFHLL